MKTILDTSALIAFLNEDATVGKQVFHLIHAREALIPAICVYELLAGVQNPAHIHQRRRILSLSSIVEFSREIAEKAAELFTELRGNGVTMPCEDFIVGATAIIRNHPVLTQDKKHFRRIPGIVLA